MPTRINPGRASEEPPPRSPDPTPTAVAVVCAIVSLCRRLQATILRQRQRRRLTPLYDTIVSSRNCRRSHLSPFPLPYKHTPSHFPPVSACSSAFSIRPTPMFLFYHPAWRRQRPRPFSFASARSTIAAYRRD